MGIKMIIINGRKFAKNESEFKNSLFSDKTCSGYYKKNHTEKKTKKQSITLYNMQKEKIGQLVMYDLFGIYLEKGGLDE